MTPELFPYQREGAAWLAGRDHALLADEMGLGKSAQAITAADIVQAKRILVLCPAVARVNWVREFQNFSSLNRSFKILTKASDSASSDESAVCSYDLADPSRLPGEWDLLILDESHYLKSVDAKRTKLVFGRDGFVRRARRVWALSGTPAPNHPGELWPLLYTFGKTTLNFQDYIKKYCKYYMGPRNDLRVTGARVENIPDLSNVLKSTMLRRKKEEVMKELPPIRYSHVAVEPGKVDMEIDTSFIKYVFPIDRTEELKQKLENEQKLLEQVTTTLGFRSHDMVDSLRVLANSVSTLRRYNGLQKVDACVELILSELEAKAYEKVVIFAIHQGVIEGLRDKFCKRGAKAVTLYGKTDPATRQRNVDNFMKNPKYKVFIGNIQAAGTAITLTSAHNIVFIEQDWVPGNNAQAAMRVHRIGQTKPVHVRVLYLPDTIDEKIARILKCKTRDLIALFDEGILES